MKKIVFLMAGVCAFGQLYAEVGPTERAASAYQLLKGFAEILVLDIPRFEVSLRTRQENLSKLKTNITMQKDRVVQYHEKLPVADVMITSFLALSEFKNVVDTFIDIVDNVLQKKLILPFATVLGQTIETPNYIGKYFDKVSQILKAASEQLTAFLLVQKVIVEMMDKAGSKIAAQRTNLTNPVLVVSLE